LSDPENENKGSKNPKKGIRSGRRELQGTQGDCKDNGGVIPNPATAEGPRMMADDVNY